jgi:membrane protein YqaA with SNARE-associated domain
MTTLLAELLGAHALEYLAVAGTAFLAATLLPFYSEVAVVVALDAGRDPLALWCAATVGNTLGAVLNWIMGLWIEHFRHRRWFPVGESELDRAQRWYGRWGKWSLLLAWLPIGGDALTFVAGILRVRFLPFVCLVGAGKGARYLAVILAAGPLTG